MKKNNQKPKLQAINGNGQDLIDQLILSIFEFNDEKQKRLSEKINSRATNNLRLAYSSERADEK